MQFIVSEYINQKDLYDLKIRSIYTTRIQSLQTLE
jgi:hypothetical protein